MKTVLVVDDDADIRGSVEEALRDEGYAVLSAENGAVALEQLRAGSRPALILLDLMMPVMSGYEFRDAQRNDPAMSEIPIVIFTADGNARGKAAKVGAPAYIQKPFKLKNLLEVVERHAR